MRQFIHTEMLKSQQYSRDLLQPQHHATNNCLIVGIDASRGRSGGVRTHLVGILNAIDPRRHGIAQVNVWAYADLLNALPDKPWLIKHNPPELERGLFSQLKWQYFTLPQELEKSKCNVLLSTDASTVCRYFPAIVMCRDMLAFESNEMNRYGLSLARLRLMILRYLHVNSLQSAAGALFLTNYARDVMQQFTGYLESFRVIPHGIGDQFKQQSVAESWREATEVKCLYVSNTDLYKHQWQVVKAISMMRKAGYAVSLELVGGGGGRAAYLLDQVLDKEDPSRQFVKVIGAVPHSQIPDYLANADLFIFASSCENMPNTLIEAMASGLPIACSNRGPMPEILQDAGAYFDPEDPSSIAAAIEKLILDEAFRLLVAHKAKAIAQQYSWERCAKETWEFLADVSMDARC